MIKACKKLHANGVANFCKVVLTILLLVGIYKLKMIIYIFCEKIFRINFWAASNGQRSNLNIQVSRCLVHNLQIHSSRNVKTLFKFLLFITVEMPGTPIDQNNSSENVSKNLQTDDPQTVQPEEPNTAPVREITQTDKLNKRLLVSFLNRMNSQTSSTAQSNEKSGEDSDSDGSFE